MRNELYKDGLNLELWMRYNYKLGSGCWVGWMGEDIKKQRDHSVRSTICVAVDRETVSQMLKSRSEEKRWEGQ